MEAGVPILDVLAKQFGVTKAEVIKMTSGGKVGFKDFEKAMFSMSGKGGMFFNMMDKQSKTLAGALSTLKDNFSKLGREIGQMLLPILRAVVGTVLGMVQGWNGLSDGFKKTVMILGSMAVAFGVALKSMMLVLKITKAISIAQAAQNVITAAGQAIVGNWKAVAVAAAAAAAVGGTMAAILSKQNDTLAEQGAQEDKNIKAVEKKLDAVKGVTDEEKKQLELIKKQDEALKNRAASIAESVLTPLEDAAKSIKEVNMLAAKGFLDEESAARKRLEIRKNMLEASKPEHKDVERARAIGAATFRSSAGFSAAQEAKRVQEQIKTIAAQQLVEQKRQTDLLTELERKAGEGPQVVNAIGI